MATPSSNSEECLITLGTVASADLFSFWRISCKMDGMPRKYLQIFPGFCRHEFGWPRKSPEGDYYQVCLICGDEYQYDWPTMQRLGKREKRGAAPVPNEEITRKASWSPRARRLKTPIPVRFRSQNDSTLAPGTIENLSQSGVFIRAERCPAEGELVEMIFEMPIEISGQKNAEVLCAGQLVRIASSIQQEGAAGFAVKVIDYRFLHSESRKPASRRH